MGIILIIDDSKEMRADFKEILELEAHTALEAENGRVGLQMIQQHSPNVIVCDVDMPEMDGIELLRTVKSDPKFSNIPFVMLTGQTDHDIQKSARDLGAEDYLTKPITVNTFLSAIGKHLDAPIGDSKPSTKNFL